MLPGAHVVACMRTNEKVTIMMPGVDMPLEVLEERVEEATRMLRLVANERRLLVLCHLLARGEMNVGSLADVVGLSQPALSQHLAQMRAEGLVATRREAQTIWYRVADPKVARIVELLHEMYCPQL